MASLGVALVGAGPWGRTLGRALAGVENVDLRWLCELDHTRRAQAGAAHPSVGLTDSLDEVLADPAVSAVAVAVDSPRHHEVGMRVLAADRHLLMEKPLALAPADAGALVATAAARARLLTVGHLLLHHPGVQRAKQLIDDGALGAVQYLTTTRVSPGPARARGSAWWALAPHDVSLVMHLCGATPVTVSASAGARDESGQDVAAFASLRFSDGRVAHVQVGRYAPEAQRRCVISGDRRALTFDELETTAPLRLSPATDAAAEVLSFPHADPLRAQCAHFAGCAARGDIAGGNGAHARAVVQVLAAGETSMRAEGAPVEVV